MSRYFKRPECREALKDAIARSVLMAGGRASARLTQLLDSSSQKVALDATKLSLQAAGIIGSGQNVSVTVGVQAGYIIDLRDRNAEGPPRVKMIEGAAGAVVVDAKPVEPIAGIGPGGREAGE